MDSLGAQREKPLIEKIHAKKGSSVFGPKSKTEAWQPIDTGGLGSILKAYGRANFEAWLDREDEVGVPNWQKWEDPKYMTMKK